MVEQTSNGGGGSIWPLETLVGVAEGARGHGLGVHMDGARLLNAVVASGISAIDFSDPVDSVWLDLSKGLGCPVGAVLAGGILPGPFDLDCYRMSACAVAPSKPPVCPYRSVARTGVTFAMDILIDALAREVKRESIDVRRDNLIPASEMPCINITGKHYDSGDYPESLRRAAQSIDIDGVRARQHTGEVAGRLIGVGFATYVEQTAHGTSVFESWGLPMAPGFEQATVRLTPDGGLELRIGAHSHVQGM